LLQPAHVPAVLVDHPADPGADGVVSLVAELEGLLAHAGKPGRIAAFGEGIEGKVSDRRLGQRVVEISMYNG